MATRTSIVVLLCAAFAVAVATAIGVGTASIVAVDLISAAAVGTAWWGARRIGTGGRLAWALAAFGLTLWFVGDILWDRELIATGSVPGVSLADASYVAGYPVFVASIVLMIRRRARHRLRSGLIDAVGVGLAAGLGAWVFLVPSVAGQPPLERVVTIAYPLADAVLLAALAWLVLSPGIRGVPSFLAVGGMATTLVLDVGQSVPAITHHALVAQAFDNLYPVAYLALALASCHRHAGELTLPDPAPDEQRLQPARVLFLSLALFFGPVTGAITSGGDGARRSLILGITVAIGAIVLTRFVGALQEVERSRAELSLIAGTDALTGLDNRRRFLDTANRIVERHQIGSRPLAALMVDVDHFKQINDTHGHAAGDAVLVELARRATSVVRPTDLVGRLGGDELAIVLPECSAAEAVAVAARLQASLDRPFPLDPAGDAAASIAVTLSIGIAEGPFASVDEALRRADHALYEAKRHGRNRVWFHSSSDGDRFDAGSRSRETLLFADS